MNKILLIIVISIFTMASCSDVNTVNTEVVKSYPDGAIHIEQENTIRMEKY